MGKRTTIILKVLIIGLALLITPAAFAQKKAEPDNFKVEKNDTLKFYKKLKKVAYRRKFTKFIFYALFVDPAPLKYEKKPLSDNQKRKDPNLKYAGSIIRKVEIIVLDPFGYSANDTNQTSINPLQKFANRSHITTRKRIVRNRLLFSTYDTLDLLRIAESERLLREARFVRDARIYLTSRNNKTDSVDIVVIVHDKWTLDPAVSLSHDGGYIRLRDKNLAGLGQTYEQRIGLYMDDGYDLRGKYTISNIKKTYISSDIFYTYAKDVNLVGISFDRPFYSALTKFAGGTAATKTWTTYKYFDTLQPLELSHQLEYFSTDHWLAYSYNPGTGKTINKRTSNIIGALRYADTRFQARPDFSIDINRTNLNTKIYLSSIGFSLRKYYKDQFIYRFGANEDVPEGLIVQLVQGYIIREELGNRNYTGVELSRGKHFERLGYLSGNFSYGTFYKNGEKNNASLNAGFFYFSGLSLERKWYVRQFVSGKYVTGFNKSLIERITLQPSEMYGFSSGNLFGSSKLILNLETVAYAPYNFIGFKFAPVAFIGFGLLETYQRKLLQSPVYQSYSLGVLVRNESLLNSSFEITFGVYPNQPGESSPVYKLNPITSFSLKVRSFTISKPGTVGYE